VRRAEKTLQDLTDNRIEKVDELLGHKESELLEV
jgi:ribosome recycling factor